MESSRSGMSSLASSRLFFGASTHRCPTLTCLTRSQPRSTKECTSFHSLQWKLLAPRILYPSLNFTLLPPASSSGRGKQMKANVRGCRWCLPTAFALIPSPRVVCGGLLSQTSCRAPERGGDEEPERDTAARSVLKHVHTECQNTGVNVDVEC